MALSSRLPLLLTIQGGSQALDQESGVHPSPTNYSVFFPCAFIFAHLALAEADNAAFQAALLLILGFIVGAGSSDRVGVIVNAIPLRFAHLALAAAEIAALPAALISPFFLGASVGWAGVGTSPPRI